MSDGARTEWVSENALRIVLADAPSDVASERATSVARALREHRPEHVVEVIPAYTCVTVVFRPSALIDEPAVRRVVDALIERAKEQDRRAPAAPRLVEVPVCYDDEFAPDLPDVARRAGLTRDEVVSTHSGARYAARFLGFSPGFAYLSGLPSVLHTPRLASPRTRVPAGSVAIAGGQAAVYPQATPGGWRIIGRTPMRVFDAARERPCLIEAGDRVRFVKITRPEFARMSDG